MPFAAPQMSLEVITQLGVSEKAKDTYPIISHIGVTQKMKPTMRYYLTPIRIAITKSLEIVSVGEEVEKQEHLQTVGGNVN